MASIQDIQQDIIDEFDMFEEWMSKYEHIIDLGKSLPLIEEQVFIGWEQYYLSLIHI